MASRVALSTSCDASRSTFAQRNIEAHKCDANLQRTVLVSTHEFDSFPVPKSGSFIRPHRRKRAIHRWGDSAFFWRAQAAVSGAGDAAGGGGRGREAAAAGASGCAGASGDEAAQVAGDRVGHRRAGPAVLSATDEGRGADAVSVV